ncbi:Major facilitator superfamily domain-containing protein isoform 1 [Schistosoma japonicum]|uniref:Major facilitator superfamily domain-containing protein isoform 1 n=2 Tax=Schistosoma japonicum TaxID=6182 RepID=A0A4Z2DHF6_SCHJA|nr:Major facilitator superfamily domain-containing protein isoform 1 [Schistosoma japonicum]
MIIAFPLMFGQPECLIHLPIWAKLLINGIFMVCVQVGWAAVQIPHLSIINDLTDHHDERVLLASLRYFFSGIGDMSTLLVTYLFFESEKSEFSLYKIKNITDNIVNNNQSRLITMKNSIVTEQLSSSSNNDNNTILDQSINVRQQLVVHSEYRITIEDLPIFRNVALIVVGIGIFFTIIFHCGIRERKTKLSQIIHIDYHEDPSDKLSKDNNPTTMNDTVDISQVNSKRKRTYSLSATLPWYAWFTLPRFWLSCCTFSIMRLSVTVSVLYMGPFVLNSLKMNKSSMVSVLLVITIFCLVTSVGVQRVTKLLGNYIGPIVGIPFILGFCTTAYFLKSANDNLLAVYFAAAILGIGNTINSVQALVVITSLIGVKQVHTSAFVHGIASFFDKILTGLFIQCIQLCIPQLTYRHIQVYIVGSLAIFGGILATIDNFIYNKSVKSNVNTSYLTFICQRTSSSSSSSSSPSSKSKCYQSNNKISNFHVETDNYTNSNDNKDKNNEKC